tara:strand:+ start:741 stop:1598 length:858 start_codon:yes stop_codon:yes gene_type:complete
MSTLYKRNLTILSVAFLIVMTLVGCGSNDKTQDENSSSSDSETIQQEESVTQEEASEEIPESESVTEESSDESMEDETSNDTSDEEEASEPACTWNVAPKIAGNFPLSGGDILANARMGAQEGYDRLVLEFVASGSVPESYEIKYVFNNSGGEVITVSDNLHLESQVQGNAALQIILAGSHEDVVNNIVIYEGPDTLSSSLMGNITEAKFGGSHAGLILWGVGVQEANGFRVFELADPPRVVVDVCIADESDKLAECLNADTTWEYPEWVSSDFLTDYCESNFLS